MEDVIAKSIAFITQNSGWAGPVIGLLAFTESLAFIGIFIPGTAILLGIGGLIGTGAIHPASSLAWLLGGAILGSWASFALGDAIGPRIYHRWPLKQNRSTVAKARLFFRKYGTAAIFLSRFLGPLRAIMPIVAGVVGMDARKFHRANVLSALVWAPAMLAPGYLAGGQLGPNAQISTREVAIFIGFITFITLGATWVSSKILSARKRRPHQ